MGREARLEYLIFYFALLEHIKLLPFPAHRNVFVIEWERKSRKAKVAAIKARKEKEIQRNMNSDRISSGVRRNENHFALFEK